MDDLLAGFLSEVKELETAPAAATVTAAEEAWPADPAVRKAKALELKAKGNAALSAGDNGAAVKAYSGAIRLDPTNHVLFSNRCAVYLKSGQPKKALADAEDCISACPAWAKGYGRRGAALFALGRLDEALEAYEEGVMLDKTNEALRDGRDKATAALAAKAEAAPVDAAAAGGDGGASSSAEAAVDPLMAFMAEVEELEDRSKHAQTTQLSRATAAAHTSVGATARQAAAAAVGRGPCAVAAAPRACERCYAHTCGSELAGRDASPRSSSGRSEAGSRQRRWSKQPKGSDPAHYPRRAGPYRQVAKEDKVTMVDHEVETEGWSRENQPANRLRFLVAPLKRD